MNIAALLFALAPALAGIKSDWIEKVASPVGLPASLCQGPLRSCYDLNHEQCVKRATEKSKECAKKLESEIPEKLDTVIAGKLAEKIGNCMEENFKTGLKKSPDCP